MLRAVAVDATALRVFLGRTARATGNATGLSGRRTRHPCYHRSYRGRRLHAGIVSIAIGIHSPACNDGGWGEMGTARDAPTKAKQHTYNSDFSSSADLRVIPGIAASSSIEA